MNYLFHVSHLNVTKIILASLSCKRATATIVSPSFRLYSGLGHNIQFDNRERRFQKSQSISISRCSPVFINKAPCRTITTSEIITLIGDISSKTVQDIPGVLSSPVTIMKDSYIWTETTTGLPWWITLVLVTLSWRAVMYLPLAIKMEQLTSRRENCNINLLPAQQQLYRPGTRKEDIRAFLELKKNMFKERKCQTYQMFLTVMFQAASVVLTSLAIQKILLTAGGSGLREATLPWGVELGFPDYMFILPVVNFLLNVIMVEVDAQRLKKETAEMKMVIQRSMKKCPNYDDTMKRLNINVRRVGCVLILLVCILLPSAINFSWAIMLSSTIMTRLALQHPNIRRRFGIERRPFETEQPYREFLADMGRYLQRKSKPVEKK